MKSWEIYNVARKALGTGICKIYGNRNARTIDYWAQDPAFSADRKRNPIDRLGALLAKLDAIGERDTAKSALRLLAEAINCRVVDRVAAVPDKETLLEEILDDMPHIVAYQSALQGDDLEEVDRAEAALARELAQNRVKYLEELAARGRG
jgi:hypothetical protein